MKAQRLRLTFVRGNEAKDLSHRQIMRALEQAMREAAVPLARSQGRRSTAQISIGAPLPLDVTSTCELADVFLSERIEPGQFVEALREGLPPGLEPLSAQEVGVDIPALQTQIRWAEYEVDVPRGNCPPDGIRHAIRGILAAASVPWEHRRETRVLRYDLRPLVLGLWLEAEGKQAYRLIMRLRVDQERSGRADQVVAALGLDPPLRVHRRRLYVEHTPPAVSAYRRWGERD